MDLLIDLHIHTNLSDGTNNPAEVLQLANRLSLSILSITDHNSIEAYRQIASHKTSLDFSGTLIPGVEIAAQFQGRFIEILAYLVNPEQIGQFLETHFNPKAMQQKQQHNFSLLKEKLMDAGFKLNPDLAYCPPWANLAFQKELWKYPENLKLLPPEVAEHPELMSKLTYDPASPFYVETNYPHAREVVDAVHAAGGLAFLAHPCCYPVQDPYKLTADLAREISIDGLEAFHSLHNQTQIKRLQQLAKNLGLYISGGSDYHGANKPKITMGVGLGNLRVPEDKIMEWANRSGRRLVDSSR